ncbi:MAG: sulfite oxidase heme-binding subunit YedZ [Bacteroidales bacterium]
MKKAGMRAAKAALFALCLVPAAALVWRAQYGSLGVNPIETITHATGDWTLRLLLLTLAVTPLRRIIGWNRLIGFRRMIGLFAFFYATLHLLTYAWLDQMFAWPSILHDIPKRPFITVGFAAFVLLVPLALTSTAGAIRRLGGVWWRRLHSLVYVAAALGVVHFWWLVKADISRPAQYGCGLAVLLLARAWFAARKRLAAPALGRAIVPQKTQS